ncbi:MAG: polyprenyl synthetase family protein [Desulfovibrionaceae bacterium]|nr:polyprenyl synthetase family protein [Desulfovibrionaceae bacterium]
MTSISQTPSPASAQERINHALEEIALSFPEAVRPIAVHALTCGGKRLRPLLTVLFAEALGNTNPDIVMAACALELFHTATLLHDDVMDNAALRRGVPTAHTLFGIPAAILAGDALLAAGTRLVAEQNNPRLSLIASSAIFETTAGAIMEMSLQGEIAGNSDAYLKVITGKTAWMIRSACAMGAALANVSEEKISYAAEYGINLGIAFQLVDDALDFAPSSMTGKPEGGDLREGKFTPPIQMYYEALSEAEREKFHTQFAFRSFSDEDIQSITAAIRTQGYGERTRRIADSYLEKADSCLRQIDLPQSYTEIFQGLISKVRNRNH